MKLKLVILVSLFTVMISCEKKDTEIIDYRDSVIGNYTGIKVHTYLKNTKNSFAHDTSNIKIILSKSDMDSIVDFRFDSISTNLLFSFIYIDQRFIPLTHYHPPVLRLINDSLYFSHSTGLAPNWIECFAKKSD